MKTAPRVRRARAGDAAGIVALEAYFPSDRMAAAAVRRLLRVPSARVWVAECGDPVGALVLLTRRNASVARIYSLVVAPRARGLGLGRRLVRAAERQARALGCTAVSLEVREDNAAARALYAQLGYVELQRLPAYYEDGAAGLRLRKPMARTAGVAATPIRPTTGRGR